METMSCHAYVNDEKKLCWFTKWVNYGPDNAVGAIVITRDGKCHLVNVEDVIFDRDQYHKKQIEREHVLYCFNKED